MRNYLGRTIGLTAKLVRAEFDAELTAAGGSFTAWVVLQHAMSEQPLSQRALAEGLGIAAPSLVRQLDRLEADGLIERLPDPSDRRILRVSITARGGALLAALTEIAERDESECRSLLTQEELRALESGLAKLRAFYSQRAERRRNYDARAA